MVRTTARSTNMSKLRIFLVLVAVVFCLRAVPAQAHVLITDNTGTIGAILHITPDDDPIAGEPSSLFFDIQSDAFSKHAHSVVLQITDDKGHTVDVPAQLIGSSVSANYIFPQQGVYKIVLSAHAHAETGSHEAAHAHTFTHTQRVARGLAGSVLDEPTHTWADIGLVLSLCSLVLLFIIGKNKRGDIAKYSEWRH